MNALSLPTASFFFCGQNSCRHRGAICETRRSRDEQARQRAELLVFFAFNHCSGQGHRRSAQKCLDKNRKEFKAFFVNWRNENSWFGLIPTGMRVNSGVLEKTAYEVQKKTGLHARKRTKGGL